MKISKASVKVTIEVKKNRTRLFSRKSMILKRMASSSSLH